MFLAVGTKLRSSTTDLSIGVVHSDHGSHSDSRAQACSHYLIVCVARGLSRAESHLSSIIVRRTVVHCHDIYYVQAESARALGSLIPAFH